jgi:hypothetical protein
MPVPSLKTIGSWALTQAKHGALRLPKIAADLSGRGFHPGVTPFAHGTFTREHCEEEIGLLRAEGRFEFAANIEFKRDYVVPIVARRPTSHLDCLKAENDLMVLAGKVLADRSINGDSRRFRYTTIDTALNLVESPQQLHVLDAWWSAFLVGSEASVRLRSAFFRPGATQPLTYEGESLLEPAVLSRAMKEAPRGSPRWEDLYFIEDKLIRNVYPRDRRFADRIILARRNLNEAAVEAITSTIPPESKAFRYQAAMEARNLIGTKPLHPRF